MPRRAVLVYALLLLAALSFRLAVVHFLPNDTPFDAQVYAQIARNVLEQHVYSHATGAPYNPSLIRLPGYPLFLAGVYALFGHQNNTAVRIAQAIIDTASCVLVTLIAFYWEPDPRLKRRSAIVALALAAVCPFTTIYAATILSETLTTFLALALCLMATLAFNASGRTLLWFWAATGLIAGLAVLFRPDSGLFAAAVGITLVLTTFTGPRLSVEKSVKLRARLIKTAYLAAIFTAAFCLVLVPWTVRNFRVFHLFQPLAPAHAEMPGEFVPRGYLSWLRTWIDDGRYIEPVLWTLDTAPLDIDDFPEQAFDSDEEKQRVAALLEKYNHPEASAEQAFVEPDQNPTSSEDEDDTEGADESNQTESNEPDESDLGGKVNESTQDNGSEPPGEDQWVEMTPEIDAGFVALARERISRHPVRYYVVLPIKRAASLWFDTHSQYFPFEGELFPLDDLDFDLHQQFWLPLFAFLTLLYTTLGIVGGWVLWKSRKFAARRWLMLVTSIIFLRLGFFATLENPEPRYVVELFPFLCILGGIAVTGVWSRSRAAAA